MSACDGEGRPADERGVLFLRGSQEEIAREMGIGQGELKEMLSKGLARLLEARGKRVRPDRDDMILADWNGLMIAALSKAAQLTEESSYGNAAAVAADFVLGHMTLPGGGLLHRYRDGEAAVEGFLDDYAFFVWGLVELYEATFEPRYLREAAGLARLMIEKFYDEDNGGFYSTPEGAGVLVRRKETMDGATPSGNSVAMFDMIALSRLTGREEFGRVASSMSRSAPDSLWSHPEAHAHLLVALDASFGPSSEVVIVQESPALGGDQMIRRLRQGYRPNVLVILKDLSSPDTIDDASEIARGRTVGDSGLAAYVCIGSACKPPMKDVEELIALIDAER